MCVILISYYKIVFTLSDAANDVLDFLLYEFPAAVFSEALVKLETEGDRRPFSATPLLGDTVPQGVLLLMLFVTLVLLLFVFDDVVESEV